MPTSFWRLLRFIANVRPLPVFASDVIKGKIMRFHHSMIAVAALASSLLTVQAKAAELKILASTAVKAVLEELGPQFERATENRLAFSFGPAAVLKSEIDKGAPFDIAILTAPLTDALVASGKIDAASRATIARAGMGVSVRAGTAMPDVSTDEAFKRTLLHATSIGYNGVGASRASNEAMFNKLGIADALKPKIKLLDVSAPQAVAKGEVEIGLGPVAEILPVTGVELAGPYPADLQSYLVFSAGVASASPNANAGNLLIKFLAAPVAVPVLKTKGLEPG
jgi:molybdate transport system substrate-binding protein